jgi:hypothetical protein
MKTFPTIFIVTTIIVCFTSCGRWNLEPPVVKSLPEVYTTGVGAITDSSALSGGSIVADGGTAIIARGVCIGKSPNPTVDSTKIIDKTTSKDYFSVHLSKLEQNTTYYIRTFATNSVGTAYGNNVEFTTSVKTYLSSVITWPASDITSSSVKSGVEVTSDGGELILYMGLCWSQKPNPTVSDNKTMIISPVNSDVCSITNLTASTTYYIRAYATNSKGTSYGNQVVFTTLAK